MTAGYGFRVSNSIEVMMLRKGIILMISSDVDDWDCEIVDNDDDG